MVTTQKQFSHCLSPNQRGAVAAASYEARRYGIHSAVPSRTAHQKCPHLIFVKPRFDLYRQICLQIREIFYRYTDWVEPLALDEAYLDVTENKFDIPSATWIAQEAVSGGLNLSFGDVDSFFQQSGNFFSGKKLSVDQATLAGPNGSGTMSSIDFQQVDSGAFQNIGIG